MSKKQAIYYDNTGSGRGPEVIAGPFDSASDLDDYIDEFDIKLTGDTNYFVEEYPLPSMSED